MSLMKRIQRLYIFIFHFSVLFLFTTQYNQHNIFRKKNPILNKLFDAYIEAQDSNDDSKFRKHNRKIGTQFAISFTSIDELPFMNQLELAKNQKEFV